MVKNFIILVLSCSGLLYVNAQDMLLSLSGKETYCIIDKVDTSYVFYTPLGKLNAISKTLVKKITPRKLFLLDGSEKNVVFDMQAYDINGPYIYYRELSKSTKMVKRYNYFACYYNSFDTLLPYQDTIRMTKVEKILYAQLDSTKKKFELDIEEQRANTYGFRSARRNFTSPWSTMGGVVTGLAGGLSLSPFIAAGPAVVYAAINSAISPPVNQTDPEDKDYVNNDYFIEGYQDEARVIKAKNSLLGAVPCLIFGILINYFRSK